MAGAVPSLDVLPGFRRRIAIVPRDGSITAALEDDYHAMAVTLEHDGSTVSAVRSEVDRAPWTTCPGAPAVLAETFTGLALSDVAARGARHTNCTHLHDLALLAAAHAHDAAPMAYEVLVADAGVKAFGGEVHAEIRRDGVPVLAIAHLGLIMSAPSEVAGQSLRKLRGWIEGLPEPLREPARLLQWVVIVAQGRAIPLDRQSDATRLALNCFTFQPGRREQAVRVGRIVDFSQGREVPLGQFDGHRFASTT
jgi:hypothetical protein